MPPKKSSYQPSSEVDYQPLAGTYDESVSQNGELHEHWSFLLNKLHNLGADNLEQRQIKTQRILRDDGATYKPHSDQERTWQLDAVPLQFDTDSWQSIEQGLLQRTELFNRLLIDIYGNQDLIHQGVIPPEAIFAHPGFLRPCFGMFPPAEKALILHAVDMIHTGERRVCILGDRTQSPGGSGYALENRTVMTRVFPKLFRDSQVRQLAMFFQSLRQKLNQIAPNGDLPNIVVLTPGSRSESYFEHAYLANYLGYSLVQGRDLTVRNGYVWTKSLSGLSRVDVILRRVDDSYCDPAELKSDSYMGVPGLIEVIRSGKVVVANPLGTGILESPVFLKYLPSISQCLLGQELQLPSAATWWAFDPLDREYILDNMRQLVIKPVFKRSPWQTVFCESLSDVALSALQKEIQQNPMRYAAQSYIRPSYTPCWQQQQFVPQPTVLRGFIVAGENHYKVMPGGLTRISPPIEAGLIAKQGSRLSKDTWVLAKEAEPQVRLWSDHGGHIFITEDQRQNLPSRVIENMFWLGRYAIRAEYALRLLRTVFVQLNNPNHSVTQSYQAILKAVTQVTETYPGFTVTEDNSILEQAENELISVTIDVDRPGSVMASLTEMLHCAEEVKVLLSADTQRVINDIRDNVSSLERNIRSDFASAPEEALDPLVTSLLAFSGLVHESMMRGFGWRFIEIGRNLERAYQTMSMIRALLVPVLAENDEDIVLETILLTLETLITYRRRYRAQTDVINGLELILLDEINPRSLASVLRELKEHIHQLPERHKTTFLTKERRLILEALSKVQLAELDKLTVEDEKSHERKELDQLMFESQERLNELATVLSDVYFDHTETQYQIMEASWEDEL